MADDRGTRHPSTRRGVGLAALGALALLLPIGMTSAAWVDLDNLATTATGSTFDIQARVAPDGTWADVGLPGSPDTFEDGFAVELLPIMDVLPSHSYAGDIFLCNAGTVDGQITDATVDEVTTTRDGELSPGLRLVELPSVEVENINVGAIIPANSCAAATDPNPPNDVEGIIHFTTSDDFSGQYGSTTVVVLKFRATSVAPAGAAARGADDSFIAPTEAAWLDNGGFSRSVTAVPQAPPPLSPPVTPDAETSFAAPVWSGIRNDPNPTPTSACFRIEIFTTSVDPAPWRVIIETDQPPFNNIPPFIGFQGTLTSGENPGYAFNPAADYDVSGRYLMEPTVSAQYASSTQSYVASACLDKVPEPEWQPPGPESYTQRPELLLVRKGSQPCVVATVDGHQPYFVGFDISFNWKVLLDEQLAADAITQAEYDAWLPYTRWASGPAGFENGNGATGTAYHVTFAGDKEATRNVSTIAPVELGSCAS